MFESLGSLSDEQLLTHTDSIVVEDRRLTLRLLVHLHAIEERRLYLTRGYGSMFDYCTKHLRFCEPAAVRRIRTARCLALFPQLCTLFEAGDVSLTTVSMIARFLTPENAADLTARIRGKSKREVEGIIAELEPRARLIPDAVRAYVVPVPVREKVTVSGDGKKSSTVEELTSDDRRAGDPGKSPAPTVVQQFERLARVQFTAHEELMSKLDRVRSLASHRLPANASLERLIEFMADYVIQREDPAARQERRAARSEKSPRSPVESTATNARHITARVRDEVLVRDGQQCTYVSPDGKRCGSMHVLQIDHIQPVARGGASAMDNLRVLCAYHNRMEAERLMGPCRPPARSRAR